MHAFFFFNQQTFFNHVEQGKTTMLEILNFQTRAGTISWLTRENSTLPVRRMCVWQYG